MADVRPFRALRPAPGLEERVVSPPYDVVDTAEARAWAGGDPVSFLRVSRPEIDLPDGTDPHSDEVYALGRATLESFVADGVLVRDDAPTYSVYRQVMGGVVQTGVVAAVAVTDYDERRVRTHEHTRPDKELDRVRHIDALDAQDEPVFLLSRRSSAVDAVVEAVVAREPRTDLVSRDGVRHTLWVVDDADEVAALRAAYAQAGDLYVADGHHRSAAASRVHALRGGGPGGHDAFLAVAFPLDDVHVMAYNRVVADLHGLTEQELLEALRERFDVAPADGPVTPAQRHSFGLRLASGWYALALRDGGVDEADPLARLDVSVLQEQVLGPLLGIGDPRTDARIAFVGGIRGSGEIDRLVAEGRAAVGFTLFPTSTEELLAVADRGEVMPPKSTWFEPKLASGLFLHPLDGA
ncbi:MAG: DUF1015 domain-containing protein [Candidatus Nanopelagicales bacterium]|jgi:uncharacterized protein (DUF1015 family)